MTPSATPPQPKLALPPEPRSVAETGLPIGALVELALKMLYRRGQVTAAELATGMALPLNGVVDGILDHLKEEHLAEVRRSMAPTAASFEYALSTRGVEQAREALGRTEYVGPAPVPWATYVAAVRAMSARERVRREEFERAFASLVLPPRALDHLGPAFNSGGSLFLFGTPGNGKTTIAANLGRMLPGAILIPNVIQVGDDLIRVFDPSQHRAMPAQEGMRFDRRWVVCARPFIVAGGELTLDALDLAYTSAKIHHAPLQLKANGGLLLIDDFGRQRVPPVDLLNRWIVPLDRGVDYLTLHTGTKLETPFDVFLVLATNLDPNDLVDEAFLRRIRYKVRVESPTVTEYAEIMRRVCEERNIEFRVETVRTLVDYCVARGIELRACQPRDVIEHLIDLAAYREEAPTLSDDLVTLACETYFIARDGAPPSFARSPTAPA